MGYTIATPGYTSATPGSRVTPGPGQGPSATPVDRTARGRPHSLGGSRGVRRSEPELLITLPYRQTGWRSDVAAMKIGTPSATALRWARVDAPTVVKPSPKDLPLVGKNTDGRVGTLRSLDPAKFGSHSGSGRPRSLSAFSHDARRRFGRCAPVPTEGSSPSPLTSTSWWSNYRSLSGFRAGCHASSEKDVQLPDRAVAR